MKKVFLKIFAILGIFFISFFINVNKANAETCHWISPLTYIDGNNLPARIKSSIQYETSDKDYSGVRGPDVQSTNMLTSFRLKYDGEYKIGYSVDGLNYLPKGNPSKNDQGGYNIYLNGTYSNILSDKNPNSNCSYKYVKVKATGGDPNSFNNFMVTITGVTEKEYISYLKSGGQYKNLFDGKTYGDYQLYANTTDNKFRKIEDNNYDGDHSYTFHEMIKKTGGVIYFVNMKESETYPKENLDTFKKILSEAEINGKKLSKEDQKEHLNALGTLIDVGEKDKYTYTKAYFDATNVAWKAYMNSGKTDKVEETRREFFSRWFNKSVARYQFEDDISQFLRYWKFIYRNDCSTTTCDLDNDGDNDNKDKKIYSNIIEILENFQKYVFTYVCNSKLDSEPCLPICTTSSDLICTDNKATEECKKSEGYKTCQGCITRCASINSESDKINCYNTCTHNQYSIAKESLKKAKQEYANNIAKATQSLSTLTRVDAPQLNIEFKPYKLKCEDVEVFHTIYKIITILAPILVILFGSLDYAKAVIASDVEKMEKSKKQFPKRILLLVLFVLIPQIVSILIELFSTTDTNLMKCIISGS